MFIQDSKHILCQVRLIILKFIMDKNNRILYVTSEYGTNVMGGLGRVVNGIVPFVKRKAEIDLLLFQYKLIFCFASCFRINHGQDMKISDGLYLNVVKKLFRKNTYKAIQFFVPGHNVVKIIEYVKKKFPETKLIYSCHSVGAFEREIRKTHKRIINAESYIINNVSAIQVLNTASLNILKKQFPGIESKKKFYIIPNGINKQEYLNTDIELTDTLCKTNEDSYRNVVCISRWSHGKGLEYLLDAIPLIRKEVKDVRFIIAGRKKRSWENRVSEYVSMIDEKVEVLKKQNARLVILGWVNDKERNALIAQTDVWIMPSMLEYFPYALLEPMIACKPIVSSRYPGVEDIIEHNKEGLLYNPKDPVELAKKIIFLLKNEKERKRLAENASAKAEKVFHWETISDMYLEMYN